MELFSSSSEYAHWDVESDVDLGAATFEVLLEGVWRACEWASAAVLLPKKNPADADEPAKWARTARLRVAGSAGGTGVVLNTTARHPYYRISAGGEVIVRQSRYSLNVRP